MRSDRTEQSSSEEADGDRDAARADAAGGSGAADDDIEIVEAGSTVDLGSSYDAGWTFTSDDDEAADDGGATDGGEPGVDAEHDPSGLDLTARTFPGSLQDHRGMTVEPDLHRVDLPGHRLLADTSAEPTTSSASLSETAGSAAWPQVVAPASFEELATATSAEDAGSMRGDDGAGADADVAVDSNVDVRVSTEAGGVSDSSDEVSTVSDVTLRVGRGDTGDHFTVSDGRPPPAGEDDASRDTDEAGDDPEARGREPGADADHDPARLDLTAQTMAGSLQDHLGMTVEPDLHLVELPGHRVPVDAPGQAAADTDADLPSGATAQALTDPFAAAAAVEDGIGAFGHGSFTVYDAHTGAAVYGPALTSGAAPSIAPQTGPEGTYITVPNDDHAARVDAARATDAATIDDRTVVHGREDATQDSAVIGVIEHHQEPEVSASDHLDDLLQETTAPIHAPRVEFDGD